MLNKSKIILLTQDKVNHLNFTKLVLVVAKESYLTFVRKWCRSQPPELKGAKTCKLVYLELEHCWYSASDVVNTI